MKKKGFLGSADGAESVDQIKDEFCASISGGVQSAQQIEEEICETFRMIFGLFGSVTPEELDWDNLSMCDKLILQRHGPKILADKREEVKDAFSMVTKVLTKDVRFWNNLDMNKFKPKFWSLKKKKLISQSYFSDFEKNAKCVRREITDISICDKAEIEKKIIPAFKRCEASFEDVINVCEVQKNPLPFAGKFKKRSGVFLKMIEGSPKFIQNEFQKLLKRNQL